jgi:galactokinase
VVSKDYVVAAIVPTPGAAAVKALLSAGFGGNSVHLHDGARIGQIRAAIYEQHRPMQRAAVSVSRALTAE